jgi:hypothetical protein
LEVIVVHEVEAFATHELVWKLLDSKWEQYGFNIYFYHTLLPYLVLLISFGTMVHLRSKEVQAEASNATIGQEISASSNSSAGTSSYCVRGASGWSFNNSGYGGQRGCVRPVSTLLDAERLIATLVLEAGVVFIGGIWLVVKGWRER